MAKGPVISLAREVDRDLRAVRQLLRQPVDAAIATGSLTAPQQGAMRALVSSGGMSLKDLSRELGLAHSTVSGIVDRLATQGLVKREADAADRRFSRIVVSEEVRTFLRDTWPSLEMHPIAEALRAAKPSERNEVVQGVRTLRRLLEARSNAAPSAQ